jgi:hypothetical protein
MLHQDFHQTTLFIDGIDFRIQNPVPHAPQKWKHESFKSYKFKQRFALGSIHAEEEKGLGLGRIFTIFQG